MPVNKQLNINKHQSENSEAYDSSDTESYSETEYANLQLQTNYQNYEVNSEKNDLLKPSEAQSAQTSQQDKK